MSHVSKFNMGDTVQCSDKNSPHFMDGGVVFEAIIGMSRVHLDMSNKIVPFHNSQLTLISVNKTSVDPTTEPTCGIFVGDQAVVDPNGPNFDSYSDQDIDQREKEKENPFEHTDLGTNLTGDELMKSIRDFCEGNQA